MAGVQAVTIVETIISKAKVNLVFMGILFLSMNNLGSNRSLMVYSVRQLHFTRYPVLIGVCLGHKKDTICGGLRWLRCLSENGLVVNVK